MVRAAFCSRDDMVYGEILEREVMTAPPAAAFLLAIESMSVRLVTVVACLRPCASGCRYGG